MPKRKHNDSEDKPRKRQKPLPVVEKKQFMRSTIPRVIAAGGKPNKMVSCYSYYQSDHTSGDTGGSSYFLEGSRVYTPWISGGLLPFLAPTYNTALPEGFVDMVGTEPDKYRYYRVMACKVSIAWYPQSYKTLGASFHNPGGQVLCAKWIGGDYQSEAAYSDTRDIYARPKTIRTITEPIGHKAEYNGADDTDQTQTIRAKKHVLKMYRKPTMDIDTGLMSLARNSTEGWVHSQLGVTAPSAPYQWGLRIDVLPYNLSATALIYYYLQVRVKWYIELLDGNQDRDT